VISSMRRVRHSERRVSQISMSGTTASTAALTSSRSYGADRTGS